MGKSTISMAIFNSYVKLPEGKLGEDDWDHYSLDFQTFIDLGWGVEHGRS